MLKSRVRQFAVASILALAAFSSLFISIFQSVVVAATDGNPLKADAIVVLGAAVWPQGQPSPALRARTMRGVELYHEGYAPNIVFTGGTGVNPPAEAIVMHRLASEAGVPEQAIFIEDQAGSTQESATLVQRIAEQHGWSKVIVVSDPFHLARASRLFGDVGFSVSTAGTDDFYYNQETRAYHMARESVALLVYSIQRPLWALSGQ